MFVIVLSLLILALASPPEHVDVRAVGRNLQIGSLYDARSSRELSDYSLWSQQTIADQVETSYTYYTQVSFISAERVLDRCTYLGLSSNLALDFMSGLVHSGGAANYLDEGVSSENQISVALFYSSTKIQKLLPKSTPIDYFEECSGPEGTHAVTEVTYGLECIFDFNYVGDQFENMALIKEELEIAVMCIPAFSGSGDGLVNLTETQQSILEKSSLFMYCDVSAGGISIPTDYDTAISFYRELPSLAGTEQDEFAGAVTIDAHLTPITAWCMDADVVVNQISNDIVDDLIRSLDKFEKLSIKVGTLSSSSAAATFPALQENLFFFAQALDQFTNYVKLNLQHRLPNVRGGFGMGEEDLVEIIMQIKDSVFEYYTSDHFLANRVHEVNAISSILHGFPQDNSNIGIADYEASTDIDFIINHKDVVMFELNILSPITVTENFLDGDEVDEEYFVYNQDEVLAEINILVNKFVMFALENVDDDYKGYLLVLKLIEEDANPMKVVAIHLGQTVSTNFEIPSSPEKTNPTIVAGILFAFHVLKESEFITGCRVTLLDITGNSTFEETYAFPSSALAGEDVEIVFEHVKPCQIYSFHTAYMTDFGYGPPSQESDQFFTDNHQCN